MVRQAQANVGYNEYVENSSRDTIGDISRNWNPGDMGGQMANPSRPPTINRNERGEDERLKYIRYDVSMSIVDRGGVSPTDSGVHFGNIVDVSPGGDGVSVLF